METVTQDIGDVGSEYVRMNRKEYDNLAFIAFAFGEMLKHPKAKQLLLQARKITNPEMVLPGLYD